MEYEVWTGCTGTWENIVMELPGSIIHGEFHNYAETTERRVTDQTLQHFP